MLRFRWIRVGMAFVVLVLAALVIAPVMAQGGVLQYGSNAIGTLSPEAPLSFFSFTGNQGDLVTIHVLGITPGLDPILSLLDAAQQPLATSAGDPFGVGDGEARIALRLPQSGTFSILVSSTGIPGDFLIRLRGEAAAVSTSLVSQGPIASELSETAPVQFFSFAAKPDVSQILNVSTQIPGFEFAVQLRNSAGQMVTASSGNAEQPAVLIAPPGGDFYEVRIASLLPQTGVVALLLSDQGVSIPGNVPPAGVPSTSAPPQQPVATEEVTVPTPTTSSSQQCVVSSAGNVNLRAGPGTNQPILGTLFSGTTRAVIGRNAAGDWLAVDLNGLQAWVFAGVVTLGGSCDSLPVLASGQAPPPAQTEEVLSSVIPTLTATRTLTSTATLPGATVPPPATTEEVAPPTSPVLQPTATFTASATSTTPPLQPTATFTSTASPVIATATFTPSYTPTTPPAAQQAPLDPRFNSPLNIPLDNTTSVLDFVSYPGGDREDRVRWDITGMNQNPSLSGGRARLVIAVSCFGTGTQHVQIQTGGQTYSCGQTIVDREVTYDSRTGQVTITAVGGTGTYVQWVLTGTATRIN
ncbi:MAG: hypothetical protein Kow0077_09960 [Anaerolineae bacterium]